DAQSDRRGAVIGEILRPETPDDVVIQLRPVDRYLPLVVVAEAPVADILTAAVAVRDDVFLAVGRMLARPHPRGWRRHRPRRTRSQRAAAATAQVAVEAAVAPVIATREIAALGLRRGPALIAHLRLRLLDHAVDRQQRDHHPAHQRLAQVAQKAAPRVRCPSGNWLTPYGG